MMFELKQLYSFEVMHKLHYDKGNIVFIGLLQKLN